MIIMKKTTLILFTALFSTSAAFAQTRPSRTDLGWFEDREELGKLMPLFLRESCLKEKPQQSEFCDSVGRLEEEKLFQEISWIMNEHEGTRTANTADNYLEETLTKGKIVKKKPLGGGISETHLVEFENGVKAVFKPMRPDANVHFEVAAYRVDKLFKLNLVPMTVWRNIGGDLGSLQYFIKNAKTGFVVPGAEARGKIRLFDSLISNTDRHMKNFLLTSQKVSELRGGGFGQVAIDHNMAFGISDIPINLKDEQDSLLFYRKLKAVSPKVIRKTLNGLLTADQLNYVLINRIKILKAVCEGHRKVLGCED